MYQAWNGVQVNIIQVREQEIKDLVNLKKEKKEKVDIILKKLKEK